MLQKFYETINSQNELQRTIQSLYATLAELFMSDQVFATEFLNITASTLLAMQCVFATIGLLYAESSTF